MLKFRPSRLLGVLKPVPLAAWGVLPFLVVIGILSACDAELPPTAAPLLTNTPTAIHTPVATATLTPLPIPTSASSPVPVVKPTPEPTPTLKATPAPTLLPRVTLVLEADAMVAGYWSDGAANVELAASLRNDGGLGVDDAQLVAVTCLQGGEVIDGCGSEMMISLPDGYGPATDTLTLRVPSGDVSFALAYGEDGAERLDVNVPERILGVDRDVWACFSDTSNESASGGAGEGIGCAGWAEKSIRKWGQTSPIRVSVNGPDGFVAQFRDVLKELSPVVNLQFEWVDSESEADITAYVGLTIPETDALGIYCARPEAFGCATINFDPLGKVLTSQIIVYNLWPDRGAALGDLDERARMRFKSAMIHEAVHVLAGMDHRTELLSIMNGKVHHRAELGPMDEALLRLHGHDLIRPGMRMSEIKRRIVFNDELLDPQLPDRRFTAWALASDAYTELREAASNSFASFRVRSSSPGCSEGFGWADYRVGNLTDRHPFFGWVEIDSAREHVYSLQHSLNEFEYWRQSGSEWTQVDLNAFSDALSGWRGELSDPHHMLESILYYADWTDAEASIDSDGRAMLRVELDRVRWNARSPIEGVEILLIVDDETRAILEYSMDWKLGDARCSAYRVEAIDGQYGVDFEFPRGLQLGSSILDNCYGVEYLGSLSGYARRSWHWPKECRLNLNVEEHARSYRFSLDGWSFTRLELVSDDTVSFNLSRIDGDAAGVVDLSARGYWVGWYAGKYGVPEGSELRWAHTPLAAGEYTVEVVTRSLESPGAFTLIVAAQPTPPPPYRFKAISVSSGRSCGLLTDGTPLCWGKRNVEGTGSEAPGGKFASISAAGLHACAIRDEGTPVCWDWKQEGEHTCRASDGGAYCRLNHQEVPADQIGGGGSGVIHFVRVLAGYFDATPPAGEKLTSISTDFAHSCGLRADGTPVCWGSNRYGEASPPPGERFSSIDAGGDHSCGLRKDDGTGVCWGHDYYDVLSAPEGERFVAITAGAVLTCGLRGNGSIVCWGAVGIGNPIPPSAPEREGFASLSSGAPYCALRSDGSAMCWYGVRWTDAYWTPGAGVESPPESERFTSISSSIVHGCGLREDGTAVCWGSDQYGQASPPSGVKH